MRYVYNSKDQIITTDADSKKPSDTSVYEYVHVRYIIDVASCKADERAVFSLGRTIPLQSEPYLIEWLENHPAGKTEDLDTFTVELLEQAWSSLTSD